MGKDKGRVTEWRPRVSAVTCVHGISSPPTPDSNDKLQSALEFDRYNHAPAATCRNRVVAMKKEGANNGQPISALPRGALGALATVVGPAPPPPPPHRRMGAGGGEMDCG
jgi:hypothetical protein